MKTKAKADRKIRVPTDADDAAINAGIAADDENPEWTKEDFEKAKSAVEVLGTEVAGKLAAMKRPRGRPAGSIKENAKVPVTMRVDPDVLEAMRETGTGWQTRVNDVLRREFIRRR